MNPLSSEHPHRTVVLGIGGAGCRAVSMLAGIAGVKRVAIDTDLRSLGPCVADASVHLGGPMIDRGTCGNIELAKTTEREARDAFAVQVSGLDLAIIAVGAGGGTGEALAPVAASVARALGIPTYVFVVRPLHCEGRTRMAKANRAIQRLQAEADGVTVVDNQGVFRICSEHHSALSGLEMAWRILRGQCAVLAKGSGEPDIRRAIQEIASGTETEFDDLWLEWVPARERMAWEWQPPPVFPLVNLSASAVDAADRIDADCLLATRPGARCRAVATATAHGERRALEAAECALESVMGILRAASLVAVHLHGGEDISLFELDEATHRVLDELHPDTELLLSTAFKPGTHGGRMDLHMACFSTVSVDLPHRSEP